MYEVVVMVATTSFKSEPCRKLNRQRKFPSDTALLKDLYLAILKIYNKWELLLRNWGEVYEEISII